MRAFVITVATVALTVAACSSQPATTTAATPAAAASARVAGTYLVSLALSGRSTYTGTLEVTPVAGDSVRGTLALTSPVRVDAPVTGAVRGDSLRLSGPYSAANGCTGTISFAISLVATPHTGPSRLVDKCVGEIPATLTARR